MEVGSGVGQFGEGRLDLHQLVESLAKARVAYKGRAKGKACHDWDVSTILAQYIEEFYWQPSSERGGDRQR